MKTYAFVVDGRIQEIILPKVRDVEPVDWVEGELSRIGEEIPIIERFTSWYLEMVHDITGIAPEPESGWIAESNGDIWTFRPFAAPEQDDEVLAAIARLDRERLLTTIYDPGINMALRALRIATTTAAKNYANDKVSELDAFAEALTAIPDQTGFPRTIVWPNIPTK